MRFVLRKTGQYVLVVFIAFVLNFALPRLMPGCPLMLLAGEDVGLLPPEARAEIIARHGLDQPLWRQFITYFRQVFAGDLGYSYHRRRPITDIILERLPWTLLLSGLSLVLSTSIGIVVGTLASWSRKSRFDLTALSLFVFLDSMPGFWLGMILMALFGAQLRWFPIFGAYSPHANYTGWLAMVDILRHLALPLTTLTLVTIAGIFLIMRYSMLNVLGAQYIQTARAKGLGEPRVIFYHAGRNALLPVITVIMLSLGFVASGTTVIETVFTYPGVGRLMFEAVMQRDYPVIQASFLIITLAVVMANIAADVMYPIVDPRVRSGR
jgi:peptide/nickel transport system permease protein